MRTKLSYIQIHLYDKILDSGLVISCHGSSVNSKKCRLKQIDLIKILQILHTLMEGQERFSYLYVKSEIKMKSSFCKYLKYLTENNFVVNTKSDHQSNYSISPRGRMLYHLLLDKEFK